FVRARRTPYHQRRRAHHAKERAVEPGELERAHKPNRGETPEQRSSAVPHPSPPREPGAPSPAQHASREKLGPPGPHPKQSPAPPAGPWGPTTAPEPGKPVPGASGTMNPPPQPPSWSDAEVIGALRRCVSELAPTGALVQTLEPIRNGQ